MAGLGNDIFGYKRQPKPAGVFSSEDSVLIIAGGSGGQSTNVGNDAKLGYLVQNWNVSYAQQVQELFELGSNTLYWAKGRPVGQGALGRVLGAQDAEGSTNSSGDVTGFLPKEAYDICDGGATMVLQARGGSCPQEVKTQPGDTTPIIKGGIRKGIKITMSGVVVTSIGFTMQVGDVRLWENITWRFAFMNLQSANNLTQTQA